MAAFTDIKYGRIPNFIIIVGLVSGILYQCFRVDESDFFVCCLGILIPVIFFFPLFLIRAMGAGDIKLMAVTGAFFGMTENVKCMILAIFIAGMTALAKMFIFKNGKERIRYSYSFLKNMWMHEAGCGNFEMPYILPEDKKTVKEAGIHFSVPLLFAAIIVMWGDI